MALPSSNGSDASLREAACDVLVVGGGINGAGIARDLAGRGLSVMLVEQDDLAAHTSSASTKLIHGGLRYLEHGEFALVRKALREREVLLRSAPHIMRPLRIVMPHHPAMRADWMIRIGLFLYDHLARRVVLPGSRVVNLRRYGAGAALKPDYKRAYVYSDGWVDDARLVVLNALDARDRGAQIHTRCRCVHAQRGADAWDVKLDGSDAPQRVAARALVNAAGPWAASFLRDHASPAPGHALPARALRLVKGSHIVVPRCFQHDHAYLFQSADGRVIFAIPYERDYTLIGTTDVEWSGAPQALQADAAEIDYLCAEASRYFAQPVRAKDVVWSYAGVRPLLDDEAGNPSAVTRDYLLEADTHGAPLLSVWGGKITTFRKLSEEAGDRLCHLLDRPAAAWTEAALLPGGDLSAYIGRARRPDLDFERYVVALTRHHGWMPAGLLRRWARAYGSRFDRVLGTARALSDLGAEVAPTIFESELDYLRREEWAVSGDDVLWRRSKLGLHCTPEQRVRVEEWMRVR